MNNMSKLTFAAVLAFSVSALAAGPAAKSAKTPTPTTQTAGDHHGDAHHGDAHHGEMKKMTKAEAEAACKTEGKTGAAMKTCVDSKMQAM